MEGLSSVSVRLPRVGRIEGFQDLWVVSVIGYGGDQLSNSSMNRG